MKLCYCILHNIIILSTVDFTVKRLLKWGLLYCWLGRKVSSEQYYVYVYNVRVRIPFCEPIRNSFLLVSDVLIVLRLIWIAPVRHQWRPEFTYTTGDGIKLILHFTVQWAIQDQTKRNVLNGIFFPKNPSNGSNSFCARKNDWICCSSRSIHTYICVIHYFSRFNGPLAYPKIIVMYYNSVIAKTNTYNFILFLYV